ncbi:hypothetical protein C8R44DRAFT_871516 [Mycena epipterygia]|nr:hypothetical protein C8R44DRAFT_871516 [Mycena epipterygia]
MCKDASSSRNCPRPPLDVHFPVHISLDIHRVRRAQRWVPRRGRRRRREHNPIHRAGNTFPLAISLGVSIFSYFFFPTRSFSVLISVSVFPTRSWMRRCRIGASKPRTCIPRGLTPRASPTEGVQNIRELRDELALARC